MFARRLATLGLLSLVVGMSWGDSRETSASEMVVYFSADSGQSPRVLEYMKRELGQIMETAGYRVAWRETQGARPEQTAGPLIVARLEGICSLGAGEHVGPAAEQPASLAWTPVVDGHVLPFSTVNCGNLTRTLAPMLAGEPVARRDFLYGRAVARVLAHEFYHILLGVTEHAAEGVAKSCFSAMDLVTERFEFEQTTLARLGKHAGTGAEAGADEAAGR